MFTRKRSLENAGGVTEGSSENFTSPVVSSTIAVLKYPSSRVSPSLVATAASVLLICTGSLKRTPFRSSNIPIPP
ncbi:hypothetical protein BC01_170 [Bacillus phage BC01]|nr:hypothetical protein BC01_170 [Bacillus phage BC01]